MPVESSNCFMRVVLNLSCQFSFVSTEGVTIRLVIIYHINSDFLINICVWFIDRFGGITVAFFLLS